MVRALSMGVGRSGFTDGTRTLRRSQCDCLLEKFLHQGIMVISGRPCSTASGGGNAIPRLFIRQVALDLRNALFLRGKEHCLFVFLKELQVAWSALGQHKAPAGRNLIRTLRRLILIGFGHKAEIDLRLPQGFAVFLTTEGASVEDR